MLEAKDYDSQDVMHFKYFVYTESLVKGHLMDWNQVYNDGSGTTNPVENYIINLYVHPVSL